MLKYTKDSHSFKIKLNIKALSLETRIKIHVERVFTTWIQIISPSSRLLFNSISRSRSRSIHDKILDQIPVQVPAKIFDKIELKAPTIPKSALNKVPKAV